MATLTVVAGPNGYGKSSFTRSLRAADRERLLDPDAIARRMTPEDVKRSALTAGREVLKRIAEYLDSGQSFAVETTLADNGPLETMRAARAIGFEVHLIFVALDTPERNIQRVRERVVQGGHDVSDEDIRRRYQRSFANLLAAVRVAHRSSLFDNSGPAHRIVLQASGGRVTWRADNPPAWISSLHLQLAQSA